MPTEPSYITFDQQRAVYDLLGLDPDRFNDTASVLIEPAHVVVTRYLRDPDDHLFVDDGTGKPATEITAFNVVGVKETTDHA